MEANRHFIELEAEADAELEELQAMYPEPGTEIVDISDDNELCRLGC